MVTITPSAGIAKLLLISDFPIDDEQLRAIRRLYEGGTSDADLEFSANRKCCQWPCRVPYKGVEITSLGGHIFFCSGYLSQRRAVVQRIHDLGCNLELCLYVDGLTEYLGLASGTMQQLADLQVQLSFTPIQQ
ncbi:MAG: hypothetical protein SH850_17935 [Planctomycetaceae bacterium]|nr:hypothetical protein [Planctomycetaceae bacterium]